MTKIVTILLIALVFEAVGVVFLSSGLKSMGKEGSDMEGITVAGVIKMIKHGATSPKVLLGIFFESIFFAGLCYLLAKEDVSLIWPLTALGFVITAISAKFFLHEQISWIRWLGISMIVVGAAVTTYSEKMKDRKAATPDSVQTNPR